jgi:hypothetical protein
MGTEQRQGAVKKGPSPNLADATTSSRGIQHSSRRSKSPGHLSLQEPPPSLHQRPRAHSDCIARKLRRYLADLEYSPGPPSGGFCSCPGAQVAGGRRGTSRPLGPARALAAAAARVALQVFQPVAMRHHTPGPPGPRPGPRRAAGEAPAGPEVALFFFVTCKMPRDTPGFSHSGTYWWR